MLCRHIWVAEKVIRHVSKLLDIDLVDDTDRYSTLAGLILWRLGHMPAVREKVAFGGLVYEVMALDGHIIDKVRISKLDETNKIFQEP